MKQHKPGYHLRLFNISKLKINRELENSDTMAPLNPIHIILPFTDILQLYLFKLKHFRYIQAYIEEQDTMVLLDRSYLRMIPLGLVGWIQLMFTLVGDTGSTCGGTTPWGRDSRVVTCIAGLRVQSKAVHASI